MLANMRLFLLFLPMMMLVHAADLKDDLTFRAPFDGSIDATVGAGDKRLYNAPNYKEQASAQPGLGAAAADIELVPGAGRKGDALRFKKKNTKAIFFKADRNVAFEPKNWTGTISFWLNLDPDADLEPGFCDPIQVTDKAYNDSAIWVDFTKDDKPRHFRLGVFGALSSWNPQNTPTDKHPTFNNRLVVRKEPAFARGKWTHVAITFEKLGSGSGNATLYLDARPVGSTPAIAELFTWEMSKAAIRLGVNYVGLLDDVAVFKRALSAEEIRQIRSGKF